MILTTTTDDVAQKKRIQSQRNVLRGLVQQPLVFWPNACTLKDSNFFELRPLFNIVRKLICSALQEGIEQTFSEQLLRNVLDEMRIAVQADEVGTLFESFHESQFTAGVAHLRDERLLTASELELQGKVARQCESIREAAVGVKGEASQGIDFGIIDSQTFYETDYSTSFLIDGIMTEGQPQLYGGPSKSLKTSVLLDQCLSLAAGVPFLGRFEVTSSKRVLLLSSESGGATLKETAVRICETKDIQLPDLGSQLFWGFRPPMLTDAEHIATLDRFIRENRIDIIGIDPAYLSLNLSSAESSNQFAVGAVLMNLTRLQADTGATPILATHFRMHMQPGTMPSLEHVAGAGFGQWARQWILLNRREAFNDENPGSHRLLMAFGGSAGHAGAVAVDIEEGRIHDGRFWQVSVSQLSEIRQKRETEREERKRDQATRTYEGHRAAILAAMRRTPKGETKTQIRDAAGLNSNYFNRPFSDLISSGEIEPCMFDRGVFKVDKSLRTHQGFRIVDPASRGTRTQSDTDWNCRELSDCSQGPNSKE